MSASLVLIQCERLSQDEVIHIPDTSLRNALLEEGVDSNGDQLISVSEAKSVTSLQLIDKGISDLTGIEAFIHLDSITLSMNPLYALDLSENRKLRFLECVGCELSTLDISSNAKLTHLDCSSVLAMQNHLTTLDVSNNLALEYLRCAHNQLTTLDISHNQALIVLSCAWNQLSSLDVSGNPSLIQLFLNNNQITSLDVTYNRNLTTLISCGNQLTSLDISANTSLVKIGIDNMPSLHEVCVWTLPFPPPGITVLSGYSPNVIFSNECN